MPFIDRPKHPMFDGTTGVPKRAIETLKKGAREMGRDPDDIDFVGTRFHVLDQAIKNKFDWGSDEPVDLQKMAEGNSAELSMRMKAVEKSFKADFISRT
jgi:hypothetical protein